MVGPASREEKKPLYKGPAPRRMKLGKKLLENNRDVCFKK